jgi:hypothetical protein
VALVLLAVVVEALSLAIDLVDKYRLRYGEEGTDRAVPFITILIAVYVGVLALMVALHIRWWRRAVRAWRNAWRAGDRDPAEVTRGLYRGLFRGSVSAIAWAGMPLAWFLTLNLYDYTSVFDQRRRTYDIGVFLELLGLVGYFACLVAAAVLVLVGLAAALRFSMLPRTTRHHRDRPLRAGEVIGWVAWTAAFVPVVAAPFLDPFVNQSSLSPGVAEIVGSIEPRDAAIWVMFACGLLSGVAIIVLGRHFDRHPKEAT